MTIIAWDGRTLAADKLRSACGLKSTATKIHRVPNGIIGFAGNEIHAMRVLKWFNEYQRGDFPVPPNSDEGADAILIDAQGAWLYGSTCHGVGIFRDDLFLAMGCGRDYAMAAMHLGCDARKAVEIACVFDTGCGNGIDVLTLTPQE